MKRIIFSIVFLSIAVSVQAKELTEIELLKLKNYNLQVTNINQAFTTQQSALRRKAQAVINPIAKNKKELLEAIEKRLKIELKDYTIGDDGELTLIEKPEVKKKPVKEEVEKKKDK